MIRGQKRPISNDMKQLHSEAKFNIHNRFDIEVVDSRTGGVKQKAYAENIVLDSLWPRLLTPNTYFNYIFFGTGTGPLDSSRTSLFSHLSYKAASQKALTYNFDNGWVSSRKQCQLSESEYVGVQLSEVGIGYGTSNTNLVTHALLKDMNGNTITITKTDIDVVNIYATVFVHWNVNGYGNINVARVNDNPLIVYLLGDGKMSRPTIQGFYGAPSVTSNNATYNRIDILGENAVDLIYTASTKKITISPTRFSIGQFNSNTGVKGLNLSNRIITTLSIVIPALLFKYPFSGIEASSITGETIGTGDDSSKDFATRFPFVKPGAKIYIDGLENTDVIINCLLPKYADNIGVYFELVSAYKEFGKNNAEGILSFCTGSEGQPTRPNEYSVYYNPLYSYGVDSLYTSGNIKIEVSDDLEQWSLVSSNKTGTTNISLDNKYKKYWKITSNYTTYIDSFTKCGNLITSGFTDRNIHFNTPPPAGAVITADYDCEVIAKDENHVFDFSFEITLGEKTV